MLRRRLEDNEHNHPNSYPPIEAEIWHTSRMDSPNNGHLQGQALPVQRRELPAAMWPQYFATFAAVLGGMTMGTAIGKLKSEFFTSFIFVWIYKLKVQNISPPYAK